MTLEDLAWLHSRAMTTPKPWSAKTFADFLETPGSFLTLSPSSCQKYLGGVRGGETPSQTATTKSAQILLGFALGRVILDEAELLTLAVDPDHHRQGVGQGLLGKFEFDARTKGAKTAFLEVAATNAPACALYKRAGWTETGRRAGYYKATPARIDAILMTKALNSA